MPAATIEVRKEGTRCFTFLGIFPIQCFGENADILEGRVRVSGCVKAVLRRKEHRTSGEHYGRIIQYPGIIEIDEIVDSLLKQRVVLFCKHKVVGNANGNGFREDDGIYEERIHWAKASNVQIDINTSKMIENEIPDGVGTLYGISIIIKGIEKPRIMLRDKLS